MEKPNSSSTPTLIRSLVQPDIQSTKLALAQTPMPKVHPDSDEHRIRVHTLALCNGELLWPKTYGAPKFRLKQMIPGYDMAGTVVEAPESSPFRVGDEVYARTDYRRQGSAREYTIVVTQELARRPQRLSWMESAAVPMSSQTAWQALFVQAGLGAIGTGLAKGKRVLVTAASGGVGAWTVQLAKLAGADVVGTCGPDNIELVRSLGADEVINYRAMDMRQWSQDEAKKGDIVIDCVGKKSSGDAWWTVRPGGAFISIFQPPDQMKPPGCERSDVRSFFFIMKPNREQLEQITRLVDEGKCHPVVDSVWPFEHFEDAYKRADSGRAKGKVVLDVMGTANNDAEN